MKQDLDDILFDIASSQQGYFTSAQAIEAGYGANNHVYHVKHGNWLREVRGIYRLAKFPHSPDGQYVIWSLWSRDRQGNVQGVYSHETALSMYDVSDVMPAKLHMTVPNKFRRGTKTPEILVLHKADLTQDDIAQKQGHRVTTPARTLLDIIEEDTQEENIIQQAVREFKTKGMISKKEICRIIEEYPKSARYFI